MIEFTKLKYNSSLKKNQVMTLHEIESILDWSFHDNLLIPINTKYKRIGSSI